MIWPSPPTLREKLPISSVAWWFDDEVLELLRDHRKSSANVVTAGPLNPLGPPTDLDRWAERSPTVLQHAQFTKLYEKGRALSVRPTSIAEILNGARRVKRMRQPIRLSESSFCGQAV